MMPTLEEYRKIVSKLEPTLRDIASELRAASGTVAHEQKTSAFDLVTKVDVEVEERIAKILTTALPGVPVVGEEKGGDRKVERYWLIDPIDGTIHFIRGNPFCTVMIALIENDKPIFSLIYVVATDELYYAVKGQGSYKDNVPIHTSSRSVDQGVVLSEIRLNSERNIKAHSQLAARYKLLNLACAGYEFLMVADGRAEGRVCIDPFGTDYDFAPGSLLVQEAGGVVRDYDGLDYKTTHRTMIIASSQAMYSDIRKTVTEGFI